MRYGSSKILQQHTYAKLIDEYQSQVNPVVPSSGKPVSRDRASILKTEKERSP